MCRTAAGQIRLAIELTNRLSDGISHASLEHMRQCLTAIYFPSVVRMLTPTARQVLLHYPAAIYRASPLDRYITLAIY